MQEDEYAVFFRNNHFSTLTKHAGTVGFFFFFYKMVISISSPKKKNFHTGFLYNLVTDIGYERERLIVWEKFDTVSLKKKKKTMF